MTCTTHHHACNCREKAIREAMVFASIVIFDKGSDEQNREFDAQCRMIYGTDYIPNIARRKEARKK